MKYLFNPATDSFEPLEPTLRDRFALGGGVIQGEKVGDRENFVNPVFAAPFIPAGMVSTIAGLLGVTATTQAINTYLQNNPEAIDTVKKALEISGQITGILPFGTKPGEQPEIEEELKELSKPKGFPGKAPDMPKSEGTKIPEPKKQDIPVNIPPKVEPLPGFLVDEEASKPQIFYRTEEEKAKAREYARKKREREKAGDTEKFRPDPEKEAVINTAIKEYRNVAPPIKPGDNRAYKPGNTGFETIKIATEEFRKQYGRNPSNTEIQKYTGNNRGTIRKAFKEHGNILGELMSMDDYRLISPKTVDTKLTEEYQEEAKNKLINEAIELDTVRIYKDEVFFKNDERRDFFIDNFIKRANFGINRKGVPGLTYEQLAKEFNMSTGQVTKAIQVLQKDPLISSQLDRPEGRDASYYGTVNKQVLAEGRKQLAPWERSNVDIQDNKVTEINKILSELTLDEVKEQYPQIITDFKWKLVKTGDDKGKIIEVDRSDEKLEKDIKKAFSIEHGKNKSTREVDIQRLTNRYLTTKKNNDLLVSIKAYIKREGESSPDIDNWLTERGIRIIVDKKGYGAPKAEAFNSKTGEHVNFNEALEFYGFDGDVVGPTKERYEVLQLKEDINKQLGEGTITTADKAPEPDSSILRRLFERFNKDNMAEGGRVGFSDGSPDPFVTELLSGLNNTEVMDTVLKNNTPSLKESMFGKEGERSFLQRLYETYDPRAFPYYAAQFTKGVALAPEFAGRLTLAAPKALADLAQGKRGVGAEFVENIDPKFTQKQFVERVGLQKIIDEMDKDVTASQRTSGDLFRMVGESVGPATGIGYFASAGKAANQIRKEIQKYAGGVEAAKELEKSIEEKAASLNMTRREFNTLLVGGGIMGLVKSLGLDSIFPAAKQVVKQSAPIVTKGGTPKYFFDLVDLIKTKGDDLTSNLSTVERQRVYDLKGYTLSEDISTGRINIRKDTEGGGSYYVGDGEYETIDGVIRKEEINYEPPETILGKDGKPVEVPDQYDEATLLPDIDGGDGDIAAGLDSIEDILELLAENGKKYNLKELGEMGINPEGLGKDMLRKILKNPEEINLLDADKMFKDTLTKVKYKIEKAGGGIVKLAGDDSGPPPKSGPTPHGLPYVAKNVRPIKERK